VKIQVGRFVKLIAGASDLCKNGIACEEMIDLVRNDLRTDGCENENYSKKSKNRFFHDLVIFNVF